MTIVALGMPGQSAAWAFGALRLLLQSANSDLQQLWVDRFDSYAHDPEARLLVCSQFPSRSLREALAVHATPAVMFTLSSSRAVGEQIEHHGSSLLEAVRTVSGSISLLTDCLPVRDLLIIDVSDPPDPAAFLGELAGHLGLLLDPELIETLIGMLGMPPDASAQQSLTESEEGIATLVLGNAVAHLRDREVPLKSIWPHRVFFSGDKPNEEAPLVSDATGSSRVLYYGPYFHLPEGRWRAKLTLGFTKEAVGLPLKVTALGPHILGEARMLPRQEGIFAAHFYFSVTDPEHPVEFHVRTEEGAIEGRIALGQVELNRAITALQMS